MWYFRNVFHIISNGCIVYLDAGVCRVLHRLQKARKRLKTAAWKEMTSNWISSLTWCALVSWLTALVGRRLALAHWWTSQPLRIIYRPSDLGTAQAWRHHQAGANHDWENCLRLLRLGADRERTADQCFHFQENLSILDKLEIFAAQATSPGSTFLFQVL